MSFFYLNDIKHWHQRIRRIIKRRYGTTKFDTFLKYGKIIGLEKWNSYCEFHRYKNTLKGKQELLGWSEEKFEEFNHSRKQTIGTMIERHGELEGKKRWLAYCNKQKTAGCSLSWFVSKYGEIKGAEVWDKIKQSTRHTMDSMITRYGEVEGPEKFYEYISNLRPYYSKMSQKLFWQLEPSETSYFAEKNKEFGKYSYEQKKYFFYDYVDIKHKKCIEFNGDYWHANSQLFEPDEIIHNSYTAKEVWEFDKIKQEQIVSEGFELLIIWESEFLANTAVCIQKCKDFLYGKN